LGLRSMALAAGGCIKQAAICKVDGLQLASDWRREWHAWGEGAGCGYSEKRVVELNRCAVGY
jgi:hypothetical protein